VIISLIGIARVVSSGEKTDGANIKLQEYPYCENAMKISLDKE
jgi:hypothetical protein